MSLIKNIIDSFIRGDLHLDNYLDAIKDHTKPPNNLWSLLPGLGVDIGASTNGSVFVLGNNANATGDFGVFKWNGASWDGSVLGGGVRIAVDSDGQPWVVNSIGQIYQYRSGSWVLHPGGAKDIGAGPNGSVWVIGNNQLNDTGDCGIFKWNGSSWDTVDGAAVQITVASDGRPWVVNSFCQILCLR